MENVTLDHARVHLEELIERAARGEDIRISDPKLGTVRLQAVAGTVEQEGKPRAERRPGRWKGKFTVPARLFEPMTEEELKLWYGNAD
jgi:antitoxin (DNA-binding transcriptional repressor) of toxin-antitoxin stability system